MVGRRTAMGDVPGLAALLRSQCGLARRSQLAALGVTHDHVARHIGAGRWRAVAPGVVAADNGRLDPEQLMWRAVLNARDRGWIAGRTALTWRGQTGHPPGGIHLLVPRDEVPPRLDGVVVHVTGRPPVDCDLGAGLPLTTAPRAVVDAAAWERHARAAAGLALAAVQQRIVTPAEVRRELDLAGRVRHRRVLREAMADAEGGAHSAAEVDVVPLVRRAGMSEPRRQVMVAGRPRDLVVDLPDGMLLAIEVDGPQHSDVVARWADLSRDVAIAAEGMLSVRFSTYAIRHEPHQVVRQLQSIQQAAVARARRA